MRLLSLCIAGLLLCVSGRTAFGQAQEEPTAAQKAEAIRRYGIDTTSSLESRVKEAPASVLKMFQEFKGPAPTVHTLTEEEKRKLSAAFAALPPLHRRILSERLRSVCFLDGMPNTALTSTVNANEPYRVFDIIIRAGVLHQTASEWLTEKERSIFDAAGSPLSVSIEAGKRDALVFVLLHEATHIVDFCLKLTPPPPPDNLSAGGLPPTAFTQGVWNDRVAVTETYRDPLRERILFYRNGKKLTMDQAEAVYNSLRRTPFVSLYGGTNWHDDLAEYLSVYHWTQVFKQPYRIVLRKEGKEFFIYEPMKSDLVRSRIGQMKQFYEKEGTFQI